MGAMPSQFTSLPIVYSTVYSGAHQRKHQSSASLAFVCGIHQSPKNSPHKWPVTRKIFPFDDVIIEGQIAVLMNIELTDDPAPDHPRDLGNMLNTGKDLRMEVYQYWKKYSQNWIFWVPFD